MQPDPSSRANRATIALRGATRSDAPAIWKLVADSGVLDPNSRYCYLLLCRDFADTCVVACQGTTLVGFVTAYRPPGRPDTVFVWQIGVAPEARRQGLAHRLLNDLVSRCRSGGVEYLEATVTPSNAASRRLFESFAAGMNAPCDISTGFTAEDFGSQDCEPEDLFRIGPFAA